MAEEQQCPNGRTDCDEALATFFELGGEPEIVKLLPACMGLAQTVDRIELHCTQCGRRFVRREGQASEETAPLAMVVPPPSPFLGEI